MLVTHRHNLSEDVRHRTPEEHRTGDSAYRSWVRRQLKGRKFVGLVASVEGRTAGSGCIWLREVHPRPGATVGVVPYVMAVYTMPEYRELGVASRIVREAMNWSREKGYPVMTLHASKMGRSIYQKLGWKRSWEMRVDLTDLRPAVKIQSRNKLKDFTI